MAGDTWLASLGVRPIVNSLLVLTGTVVFYTLWKLLDQLIRENELHKLIVVQLLAGQTQTETCLSHYE